MITKHFKPNRFILTLSAVSLLGMSLSAVAPSAARQARASDERGVIPVMPIVHSIQGCNDQPDGSTTNCPPSGGVLLTITGENFLSPAIVLIGGIPAPNVIVANTTTITCTLPAGEGSNLPVTVVVAGQVGILLNGFSYFGSPAGGCPGDANQSGAVDFDDITAVLAHWQETCQ